jgi:hypothetical protein
MLADEESTTALLMGLRKYKSIDDSEFAKRTAGMFSIEANRILRHSGPALFDRGGLISAARAELGIYPGTTSFGIDTRTTLKNLLNKDNKNSSKRALDYSRTPFEGLTKKQKNKAISSLDKFNF